MVAEYQANGTTTSPTVPLGQVSALLGFVDQAFFRKGLTLTLHDIQMVFDHEDRITEFTIIDHERQAAKKLLKDVLKRPRIDTMKNLTNEQLIYKVATKIEWPPDLNNLKCEHEEMEYWSELEKRLSPDIAGKLIHKALTNKGNKKKIICDEIQTTLDALDDAA